MISSGVPSRRLDRARIVDACLAILESAPVDQLTLRRLGVELGVDPTAVYRHFRDKDELLRAVGDRLLDDVLVDLPSPDHPWRDTVMVICRRVRAAHLSRPDVASFVRGGPSRHDNEFAITEALLGQLARAGLAPGEAAQAYHALIELTVGSAALDADMASLAPALRSDVYDQWRRTYAVLDASRYPHLVEAATFLYRGGADDRFDDALASLLDGLTRVRR